MENAVSINHTRDNTLEFELSVEGVKDDAMSVKFVVEAKGVEIGFVAERKDKKKDVWMVKIPPLSFVKSEIYPFFISTIIDGYQFVPMKGILNITGETKLFAEKLKNTTFDPAKVEKKAEKPKKKEEPKSEEKVDKVEPKKEVNKSKDQKVKEALSKIGDRVVTEDKPEIKPGHTPSSKFSLTGQKVDKKPIEEKKEPVKETKTVPVGSEELEKFADELLKKKEPVVEKKEEPKKEAVVEKKEPEKGHKNDEKVLAVLEEVGITPKSRQKRPRISFIKSEIFPEDD